MSEWTVVQQNARNVWELRSGTKLITQSTHYSMMQLISDAHNAELARVVVTGSNWKCLYEQKCLELASERKKSKQTIEGIIETYETLRSGEKPSQDVQADKKARSPERYEAPVAGCHTTTLTR